jgi:choline dehydrogenase-like flavoprotein
MQVQASPQIHDVLIIGSGAAGGMAAWNLTRQGVNVTMLDAGRKFNRSEFWTHVKPWEWQQRLDAGQKPPQIVLDPAEQPYITPLG